MVEITNIKKIIKEIENKYNLNYYEVLQRFMFERVLERISVSNYRNNFILKGGLLLSAMFGIENRMTKDIDATIKGLDVSKDKIIKVLNEILSIDLGDNVKFDIVNITDIREDDAYGGNKYHIVGKIQNLSVNLEIDISTGDKVTPRELKYKYPLIFEDRTIIISSYNIETILAEKIETILRRGIFNSRMKDFYDVYFFLTNLRTEIDIDILKSAIRNTFIKRDSFEYLNDYEQIIDYIIANEKITKLWNIYSNKYKYANDINLDEILILLKKIIKELDLVIAVS